MDAELIRGIDSRFTQMVISIYLDGAIKTAGALGIESFVMVAPGRDLVNAVNKQVDGWHYKILVDDQIYIASMAMQQLVVARGIDKMLPWVQNRVNPRVRASLKNGRIVAEINRQLLLQAGDVETNPGPNYRALFFLSVAALVAASYPLWQDFHRRQTSAKPWTDIFSFMFGIVLYVRQILASWVYGGVDWACGRWLDDAAYDCAVQRHTNDQWTKLYGVWVVGKFLQPVSRWVPSLVPSYGDLQRETLFCRALDRYWGLPDAYFGFGVYNDFVICLWYCVVTWMAGCAISIVVIGCYITRGVRRISVVNKQKPFVVNHLKDSFRRFAESYKSKHYPGTHSVLASQRRKCEEWCLGVLLDKFQRVRDVGGSRSRWPELGFAKHVCGPVISNDDILREDKSRGQFENCGKCGQYCPLRTTIPAAMFSHVDYHMTLRQLSQCVSGPAFIINHDFNRFGDGVGKYIDVDSGESRYEAAVKRFGSRVSMTPDNGTPYLDHPYHNWQSEGSVVSPDGAFTYVRLGDFGETSVYYCHPSDGVYNIEDPNSLTTKFYGALPMVCGYRVTMDQGMGLYRFTEPVNLVEVTVPIGVVDKCAIAMASCIRDEKYPDTLRSYSTGKLTAAGIDENNVLMILGLISYLSDLHAVKTVPFASCIMGHPVNFRWYDIVKYRIILWLSYFRGDFGHFLRNWVIGNRVMRTLTPWMFNTVRVPSYEAYTNRMEVKFGTGLTVKFNKEQFPTPATPVVPSVAGCGQYGPSKNVGQCVNIDGDSGAECSAPSVTTPDSTFRPVPAVRKHAPCPGSTTPPQPEPVVVEKENEVDDKDRAGVSAKSSEGTTDGELKGSSSREISAICSDLNLPLQRGQCDTIYEPIFTPGTVVSCEILDGAITSLAVDTKFGTTLSNRVETNVSTSLRDSGVTPEELCFGLTRVLRQVEEIKSEGIDYWSILNWGVRFVANPHGRPGDKSIVPQGYGLLPLVPPAVAPIGFKTFALGNLGIAVSSGKAPTVNRSKGKGRQGRPKQEGRPGKMLLENRDVGESRGS